MMPKKRDGIEIEKTHFRNYSVGINQLGRSTEFSWDTRDYRSFLNYAAAPAPEPVYPIKAELLQGFSIQLVPEEPGRHHPWHLILQVFAGGGNVSPKHAAIISKLLSTKATGTAEWLILQGRDPDFGVKLDGEYMKNVIVKNMRVHYDGGALLLRNVFFVNCAFSLRRTPASARLGKSLLASAATDFSSGPAAALQGSQAISHFFGGYLRVNREERAVLKAGKPAVRSARGFSARRGPALFGSALSKDNPQTSAFRL